LEFLACALAPPRWLIVFSRTVSLLLGQTSRSVIGLWSCRRWPDSLRLAQRREPAHGTEMYYAALPLLAVQFTPKGALPAGVLHGGVSDA